MLKNHCIVHLKWVSVWRMDYFSIKLLKQNHIT